MTTKKLENAIEVKEGANGLKTIIGAVLLVLAHQLDLLKDLTMTMPEYSAWIMTAQGVVVFCITWLSWASENGGVLLMVIGIFHKAIKFFKG